MTMITAFLVDNSAQPLEERRFGVRKLLVKCKVGCGENMSKKTRPSGCALYPQFVSRLSAACSPLEYLLAYVVIAVDVVVLLSQRREGHCELSGPSDVSTAFF